MAVRILAAFGTPLLLPFAIAQNALAAGEIFRDIRNVRAALSSLDEC